jgi:hypothetical protein
MAAVYRTETKRTTTPSCCIKRRPNIQYRICVLINIYANLHAVVYSREAASCDRHMDPYWYESPCFYTLHIKSFVRLRFSTALRLFGLPQQWTLWVLTRCMNLSYVVRHEWASNFCLKVSYLLCEYWKKFSSGYIIYSILYKWRGLRNIISAC